MDRKGARRFLFAILKKWPEPKAQELAILCWESVIFVRLKRVANRLTSQFPFLLVEEQPEAAAAWFAQHDISCWPIQYSAKFTQAVIRLMLSTSFVIEDFDSVPTRAWWFLMANKIFAQSKEVKRYLDRMDVRNKLKRIFLFSNPRCRSFTVSPRNECDRRATVTPFLKNGIFQSSKFLVTQSLAFTQVRFTPEITEAIIRSFPDLEDDVIHYKIRLKMQTPSRSSEQEIAKAAAQFAFKKKFLRTLCRELNTMDPIIVELFRMFVITRVGELRKAEHWFYSLRFLRMVLKTERRMVKYRADTIDHLESILKAFECTSDWVIRELVMLVDTVFPNELFRPILEKFPELTRTDAFVRAIAKQKIVRQLDRN
jgi:hypothetical protein